MKITRHPSVMIWLYRILFVPLLLLILPYYRLRMGRRGGYRSMMPGRCGHMRIPPRNPNTKRIWIQAVSVGEVMAVEGLVKCLAELPATEIILTTTTSTAFRIAKDRCSGENMFVESFPLDFYPFVRRAWNRIDPQLTLLTEGELWPEHMHAANCRKTPLLLINGRLSDKSFNRIRRLKTVQNLLFGSLTAVAAASESDARRLVEAGCPRDNIVVTGNLKFDAVQPAGMSSKYLDALNREVWAHHTHTLKPFTIIGASTWPGEEQLLIETSLELSNRGIPVRLILTPRHAERRAELRTLLLEYPELSFAFRTHPEWKHVSNCSKLEVHVADTTGELRCFLQLADIAVIGKTFPPHKLGQTPVEAAALGIPIVYGPGMGNFKSICEELESSRGAFRVEDPSLLAISIETLLLEPERRSQLIKSARMVFENNQGSTRKTLKLIQRYF